MITLNTTRSEKMAKEFLAKKQPFNRKVQTYKKQISSDPETIFEQLCPTREADWIDGWVADLIYTETGYAEPDCILRTPQDNILGPGLWIITDRRPNSFHEFLLIRQDGVVGHFTIEIEDNGDGTCETLWKIVFTAVNEQGNEIIEMMPDKDPMFEEIILALDYYLNTGERMEIKRW